MEKQIYTFFLSLCFVKMLLLVMSLVAVKQRLSTNDWKPEGISLLGFWFVMPNPYGEGRDSRGWA